MHRQTVQFAVTRNNGNITRIGRTGINQPKTNFKGGSVNGMRTSRNGEAGKP